RERYIWELLWPRLDDALYLAQPEQYRSELADRFATPLYPLAFTLIAFAFLGSPQTTRQNRTLALMGMILTIGLLRLIGFISVVVGVRVPSVLALQYVAIAGTIAACLWHISRGRATEPAIAITKLATAVSDRIVRVTGSS
ncbi:MAG: LptF/LptG family permease, partial [Pseudolabrys sp.]|nr:LptF/LptG family permease [Pseudolabrys sp.]